MACRSPLQVISKSLIASPTGEAIWAPPLKSQAKEVHVGAQGSVFLPRPLGEVNNPHFQEALASFPHQSC